MLEIVKKKILVEKTFILIFFGAHKGQIWCVRRETANIFLG
jgi:hypothetical protein